MIDNKRHPDRIGFIDLHTHTDESDGTYTPQELISAAAGIGLSAIAITDHDTFSGFEKAAPFAREAGLNLVQGIELNSRLGIGGARLISVHVLAYFLEGEPSTVFLNWLSTQREERRDRNTRLAKALQDRNINISIEEVEGLGRSLAGRPHFARLLVEKGYATGLDDAFNRFIGEDAPVFVERQSPTTEAVIQLIRAGGGIPVIAHPVRSSLPHDDTELRIFEKLKAAGLAGLEVIHSEHSPDLQRYYRDLAEKLELLPSGGSDFHGRVKPDIRLGFGRDSNVAVPVQFLDGMRSFRRDLITSKF